jgi:Protein of unknown function (DUF2997)
MREKFIKINIKNGKVSFTVEGVKGDACLAETKFLEDALGGQVLSQEKTAEYYEEPEIDTVTGRTGGE